MSALVPALTITVYRVQTTEEYCFISGDKDEDLNWNPKEHQDLYVSIGIPDHAIYYCNEQKGKQVHNIISFQLDQKYFAESIFSSLIIQSPDSIRSFTYCDIKNPGIKIMIPKEKLDNFQKQTTNFHIEESINEFPENISILYLHTLTEKTIQILESKDDFQLSELAENLKRQENQIAEDYKIEFNKSAVDIEEHLSNDFENYLKKTWEKYNLIIVQIIKYRTYTNILTEIGYAIANISQTLLNH